MSNYVNGIVGITIRNCVICAIINTVINYFWRSSTVADYWWFGGGASAGKEIEKSSVNLFSTDRCFGKQS